MHSKNRAIVAVCADVESARQAMIKYAGRWPRCYQRNIHAEESDVYVHVIVANIDDLKKGKRK